jgi:hypothetical protein
MGEKMKSRKRQILVSAIIISLFLNLSTNFLQPAAAGDPEFGISEGDSLVYQLKTKASANGRTARETQYVKYTITNIPSGSTPIIITGDAYLSSSTSFDSPTETDKQISVVESFPKVGDLIVSKNSLFGNTPSEITQELYLRFLENLDSEITIKSFSIDSYDVLAKGLGYDVALTVITENQTVPSSTFYSFYHELYMVMTVSMQGYYSSTGICLREDIDLTITAFSQEYADSSGEIIKWGSLDILTLTMEIQQRIQSSLSTPEGVSELPWISTAEWILIIVSGPGVIAVVIGIIKQKEKKKKLEKVEIEENHEIL